jgi:DNA-binding HxlR family transcriptional regulator
MCDRRDAGTAKTGASASGKALTSMFKALPAKFKTLEEREVIASRLYQNHPPRQEYYLTSKGEELGPVLKALYQWGEKHQEMAEPRRG